MSEALPRFAGQFSKSALAEPPALLLPSATGIDVKVVLAGPGARSIAFVLDWLIRSTLAMAYVLLAAWLILGNLELDVPTESETVWYLAGALPGMAIYFLYHLVLETLMHGRTPGKRMIGVRVLTPEGHVPTIGALVTRNLFRIVDAMPVLYLVGLLAVMFGKRHLRLGDLAAGTVLAMDRAPFLEKLAPERRAAPSNWQAVRQRALRLGGRHSGEVAETLDIVDDYRRAAHELGAARTRRADAASPEYLEAVYADLHDVVHRPARRASLVLLSLMRDRVPAALGAMRVHLAAVTLLFVSSVVAGWWLIHAYPDLIALFASPQLIATVERGELWTDGLWNVLPAPVLSFQILTNNIMVAVTAFCAGLIFGLGTFYIVTLNGFSLGATFAFTSQHELGGRLFDFVVAHGCVELSCICIAGAAGAYLGEALIRPGELTRSQAFRVAAADGTRVLVVVTLLLLICGFIEGYVSPNPDVPRWARITIGVGYWLFMLSLLSGHVFGKSRGGKPVAV